MVEDDIGDRDVLESAARFSTQLDSASRSGAIGDPAINNLVGRIDDRADFKAADEAIANCHVLAGAHLAEGVGTLEADTIIVGGVDRKIGKADVSAAVDVDRVAIG